MAMMKLIGMNVDNPDVFKDWTEQKFVQSFQMSCNYPSIPQPARDAALRSDWAAIEKAMTKKAKSL